MVNTCIEDMARAKEMGALSTLIEPPLVTTGGLEASCIMGGARFLSESAIWTHRTTLYTM